MSNGSSDEAARAGSPAPEPSERPAGERGGCRAQAGRPRSLGSLAGSRARRPPDPPVRRLGSTITSGTPTNCRYKLQPCAEQAVIAEMLAMIGDDDHQQCRRARDDARAHRAGHPAVDQVENTIVVNVKCHLHMSDRHLRLVERIPAFQGQAVYVRDRSQSEARDRSIGNLVRAVRIVVVQESKERAVPRSLPGKPLQKRPVDRLCVLQCSLERGITS